MGDEGQKVKATTIVYLLGLLEYGQAYQLQRKLQRQRSIGTIADTLLILEHPPTITIGKSGKLENILVSKAELARQRIALFFADRGGDVTYHSTGQLVGYPIFYLERREGGLHKYVHDLEEVLIRTLNDFGIKGSRDFTHAGVWIEGDEIATIGINVQKWVSSHGFALNVNLELQPFSLINPCGFSDRKATSMSKVLSRPMSIDTVAKRLLVHFAEVFNTQLELKNTADLRGHV